MSNVTFTVALIAGVLSFLSPCVLPLVPVYLANIAGTSVLTSEPPNRKYILLHAISFVAGFSLVFTALGAVAGALGSIAPTRMLEKIAGVVLIMFGIFLIAATKLPWLNYEKHLNFNWARRSGYLRSLSIGAIFSLGWTACLGPVLGGILALAAWGSETAWQGILLLLAYCLGLGLPFLGVSLAIGASLHPLRWLSRHAFITSIVSAVLLISIGALMLTGYLSYIIGQLTGGW